MTKFPYILPDDLPSSIVLPIAADLYGKIVTEKEALLRGWVAWVALQNPNSSALSREHMHALFGPWIDRKPELVRRDDGGYEVRA